MHIIILCSNTFIQEIRILAYLKLFVGNAIYIQFAAFGNWNTFFDTSYLYVGGVFLSQKYVPYSVHSVLRRTTSQGNSDVRPDRMESRQHQFIFLSEDVAMKLLETDLNSYHICQLF